MVQFVIKSGIIKHSLCAEFRFPTRITLTQIEKGDTNQLQFFAWRRKYNKVSTACLPSDEHGKRRRAFYRFYDK